ncbi:MAG: AAA family ATPase [Candidatus Asgardarchaeia archaeon]
MIKALTIKNFKSIKEVNLNCKRINLFVGDPNTGKSNLLESIALLSYIYHGKNEGDIKNFVRMEYLMNMFYDNDLSENVSVDFDGNTFLLKYENGNFIGTYRNEDYVVFKFKDTGELISLEHHTDFSKFKFYRFRKMSLFPNMFSGYLYPANGNNLLSILLTNKTLRSIIKQILETYEYKLVLNPAEKKILIEKETGDILVTFPYHLLSETLQRIFFYLAALISNRDSIVCFEEPEAHAFPQYTKFLAERIALEKNNQFFISTHNPYFAISLIEKAPKDEINVFLTYIKDYKTQVKPLELDEIESLLDFGADLFFNLDKFLEDAH